MILQTRIIQWLGFANLIHGVGEEIFPDGFVAVVTVFCFREKFFGEDGSVCSFWVVFYINIGNEAAGVFVGRLRFFDIHDGAEFIHSKEFPGAAIVVFFPALVENVGVAEVALLGGGGDEALPSLVLIAGAAEGDDSADLGMLREAGGSGGSVGTAGEDDVFPVKIGFISVEKVAPLSLRVFFGEVFDELESALFDRVGFGDGDLI